MSTQTFLSYSDALFNGVLARNAAVADATPRLSYYGSIVPGKESWVEKPEGYRVYLNVPIARTGSQNYVGREIKRNPGYNQEWNIADDDVVTVYRPIEEVTATAALASFEGMSVLDQHPADPQILIDALDEYEGISKGHGQNVRVGDTLVDGETSVIADLHVKHPDLNMKVDSGIRDVSCGYTFLLAKDSDGRYIQTRIRGNHIAIVPRGRAGSEVGIKDSEPELKLRSLTMKRSFHDRFAALGFQFWAKDAKPDEVADAMEEFKGEKDAQTAEQKAMWAQMRKDDSADTDDSAKDKKAAKDKASKDARRAARDASEHPKGCMCDDCMDDRKGAKDDEDDVDRAGSSDADDDEEEKKKKKDKDAEKDSDGNAIVLSPDEHSKSDFSVGDAAKLLDALKPAVAKSKDKGVKDAYTKLRSGITLVQDGVKDGVADPFAALAHISPEGGVGDNAPEIPMFEFFNGQIRYADGVKAYNDYVASRVRK